MTFRLLVPVVLTSIVLPLSASAQKPPRFSGRQLEHFEKVIRPLLVKRCHKCHSARSKSLKAELRLDSRSGALKGGETGPALKPGDPAASRMIQAIRYDGDYKMPPSGKLPAREIRLLTDWVRAGAAWTPGTDSTKPQAAEHFDLPARRASHWAWQPVRKATPRPLPENLDGWPTGPFDRFIANALDQAGLQPAPDADRATWLRRVTFDLAGLPPTPEALEAFLVDSNEGAHVAVQGPRDPGFQQRCALRSVRRRTHCR